MGLELAEQRRTIRRFFFTMSIGYAFRIPIQFLYGSYHRFIKEWYWRWVLYLISNPVFELPTLFFCFIMHYKSFKTNTNDDSTFSSSDNKQSTLTSVYTPDKQSVLHFIDLHANDELFYQTYKRFGNTITRKMSTDSSQLAKSTRSVNV